MTRRAAGKRPFRVCPGESVKRGGNEARGNAKVPPRLNNARLCLLFGISGHRAEKAGRPAPAHPRLGSRRGPSREGGKRRRGPRHGRTGGGGASYGMALATPGPPSRNGADQRPAAIWPSRGPASIPSRIRGRMDGPPQVAWAVIRAASSLGRSTPAGYAASSLSRIRGGLFPSMGLSSKLPIPHCTAGKADADRMATRRGGGVPAPLEDSRNGPMAARRIA